MRRWVDPRSISTVLLVASACCRAEPAPDTPAEVKVLDARAALPQELSMIGQVVDAVRFSDASGEGLLAVSLFRKGEPGEDLVSEVHARQWRKSGAGYALAWKLRDFSSHPLEWVEYASPQYKIVDADRDGVADTQLWYAKVCDGLDPDTLKLMLYVKGRKLAIRGVLPKHADDLERYGKHPDPALASAPEAVQEYLSGEWDALTKAPLEALKKEAEE